MKGIEPLLGVDRTLCWKILLTTVEPCHCILDGVFIYKARHRALANAQMGREIFQVLRLEIGGMRMAWNDRKMGSELDN